MLNVTHDTRRMNPRHDTNDETARPGHPLTSPDNECRGVVCRLMLPRFYYLSVSLLQTGGTRFYLLGVALLFWFSFVCFGLRLTNRLVIRRVYNFFLTFRFSFTIPLSLHLSLSPSLPISLSLLLLPPLQTLICTCRRRIIHLISTKRQR